jgi:hypothetical protein
MVHWASRINLTGQLLQQLWQHTVVAEHHRLTSSNEIKQKLIQVGPTVVIQPVEGFIKQQHIGLLTKDPSKQHALLLAAGERRDRAPCQSLQPKCRQVQITNSPRSQGVAFTAQSCAQINQGLHIHWHIPTGAGSLWQQSNPALRLGVGCTAKKNATHAGASSPVQKLEQG